MLNFVKNYKEIIPVQCHREDRSKRELLEVQFEAYLRQTHQLPPMLLPQRMP